MTSPPVEVIQQRVSAGEPILDILPYKGTPYRVFAFIDVEHPVVAWASYRGVLVSANVEFSPPSCPISMMFAGIIRTQNNVRLHNELLIEKYRQQHFPHCISRLTGMYFFENRESASCAHLWGGHFLPENLAEVLLFSTNPISRHDANWITFAPVDVNGEIENEDWIQNYWSGEPFPAREPAWELIAQGRAVICGSELRIRAYNNVYSNFPDALSLLEIGRIAAHLGSDLGQISAWLLTNEDGTVSLSFHIDMRDANEPQFLAKLQSYSGPRNIVDLAVGGDHFGLPSLDVIKCQFNVTNDFLASVHINA
jgi:hypothetical protein